MTIRDYLATVEFGMYKPPESWEVCASSVQDLDEAARIRMGREHKFLRTMTIQTITACHHQKGVIV